MNNDIWGTTAGCCREIAKTRSNKADMGDVITRRTFWVPEKRRIHFQDPILFARSPRGRVLLKRLDNLSESTAPGLRHRRSKIHIGYYKGSCRKTAVLSIASSIDNRTFMQAGQSGMVHKMAWKWRRPNADKQH
jgi:hypothetical protein